MTGSASQVEWAERIQNSVRAEFERVASAFRVTAERQQGQDQLDTLGIIAILEDKRAEVLSNEDAGYYVRTWQEISDQVRLMLIRDARVQTIQSERRLRKATRHVV